MAIEIVRHIQNYDKDNRLFPCSNFQRNPFRPESMALSCRLVCVRGGGWLMLVMNVLSSSFGKMSSICSLCHKWFIFSWKRMGHDVFYDISCCSVQEEISCFSQCIFSQFLLILVLVSFSSGNQKKECVKFLQMPYVLCSAIKT